MRPWSTPCEETSIAQPVAPPARKAANFACREIASGVVFIAASNSPGNPLPKVPITAVLRPRRVRVCAIQCEQDVLPLVPVTPASHKSREGVPKKRLAISPKCERRSATARFGTRQAVFQWKPLLSHNTALAPAAIASAVLWDSSGFHWNTAWRVPNLAVADLRSHLGEIASRFFGTPSRDLWLAGVTGTNGKTSCSHWIAQTLTRLGRKTAVIGTLGSGFPGELDAAMNTTPDAISLQAKLAALRAGGATGCAMEVSSHGVDQGRINGGEFDVALFTNLTSDCVDYHQTLENYVAAKARLFHWPGLKHGA